ncbi:matrix metalloproteinase-14-like [Lytechinus pictus]|uniref:matrix metalloproteinase-14-like n=1 Tax=Lytechinus pictus TaxID=7653 RepID=UPI0030BA1D54
MEFNILFIYAMACIAYVHSLGTNEVLTYLSKYNYFASNDLSSGHLRSQSSLNDAIRLFQRINGLNETGIIDANVQRLMQMPRCGLPDNTGSQAINRARRYALSDNKWYKKDLTWKLENTTPDLTRQRVQAIIARALKHWSDASQLTFREVQSGDADLVIKFTRGDHGDGNPFDGPGNVLAHAFFPTTDRRYSISGDAHFDEDERYTENTDLGTNLFQVAVHEFGHSFGLGHSNSPDAIMAAIYRGYVPNAKLHRDDIAGIQALYGANSGTPEVKGTEGPKATGSCVANFVAAAQTLSAGSFMFNDTHAFLMDIYGLVTDPEPISSVFRGLPTNLDAAFYYENTGKTYFFKGSLYWRFTDLQMDRGYPNRIRVGFGGGIPDDIDAAFVWSGNGMTYFVKGANYYRYNFRTSSVDPGYPKPLSIWNGIGTKVDAAFQFENKLTYFFTDGEYRRFDDNNFKVATDYPQRSTRWLKCEEMAIVASPGPTTEGNMTSDDGNDGSSASKEGVSILALCACVVLTIMRLQIFQ